MTLRRTFILKFYLAKKINRTEKYFNIEETQTERKQERESVCLLQSDVILQGTRVHELYNINFKGAKTHI